MAINFPGTPALNDTFTEGGTTWKYDGTTWNVSFSPAAAPNIFTRFNADTGFTEANIPTDSLTVAGGTNVTTAIVGDTITINGTAGGGNAFGTITADEGSTVAASINDTLNIVGGTNIATAIATDTDIVEINMAAFSIDFLSDVDTTSSTPTTGQVLKWNGAQWAPGADATTGGAGTDADTLDGFDGSYYLDYNNLNNKPTILALSALSVGVENSASGNGAISYNNATGEFKFTPPTAAGIGALTTETNDLTAAVTWANVPNANITESSVTQHQAALSITESQVSDLGTYLSSSSSINALSDVDTTTAAPSTNDVLQSDGSNWVPNASAGGGDANQNAFSTVSVTGQSDIEADTATDTITFAGASGITITTNAASDIVTFTGPGTIISTFSGLSDVITAQLTIDKLYLPAITRLDVTNNGASAYRFDQYGTSDNPTIYAINGTTIAFNLTAMGSSHPFLIQTSAGVNYNDGLTHVSSNGTCSVGSNAQGKDTGTLYWKIPSNISGSYRYQCSLHAAMVGTISIKNFSSI
jgi:plastocyanin